MKYHIDLDIDFQRNHYSGKFIALEGIDGSGKSTQVERLKKALEEKGRKVVIRHPFEGEIGVFVRTILSGERKVSPIALQYLITANRADQQETIKKDLESGVDVIIDRYFWSAVVYGILDYSDISKEEMKNWLLVGQGILSQYHRFLAPDFTFFLDISTPTATKRIDDLGKEKEIYEDEVKIKKSEEIYKWLISEFPDEFVVINGEQPVEKVTDEMIKFIEKS